MSDRPTGWTIAEARAAYKASQASVAELTRDLAATSEELVRVLYALELANGRLERMQRELDASHVRERVLVAELGERKRQEDSTHSTPSNVTPLRPRKP